MRSKHIAGLDQLRFFMALWVTIGHCELYPNLNGIVSGDTLPGIVLRGVIHNMVNGPAAVIVFFVISGFCIHLPYRDKTQPIPFLSYFTRRYVRICAPLVVALLLAKPLELKLALFERSILWSLICEEIYYLVYPLLRATANRIGWRPLILFAFTAAFVLALTDPTLGLTVIPNDPTAGDYPSFGWRLNWLLGLPCWLLGCLLAEKENGQTVTLPQLLGWRSVVWAASAVASVLRFHSPIKYPFTLNLFAVLVFFWLSREIAYYRDRDPMSIFEGAGKWSYSLYLVHPHAQLIWKTWLLFTFPPLLRWPIHLAFILSCSYVFYRLVEKPTHNLARRLSLKINRLHSPAAHQLSVADSG